MDYSKLVTENRNEASKVYKNLMVDMVPTNKKLEDRAIRIIRAATGVTREMAEARLKLCGGNMKAAIVCCEAGVSPDEARAALERNDGFVGRAIDDIRREEL